MPHLFFLFASAIAGSFILPEIKTLCVDQSPVKKEYNLPHKLNDTTFLLKGKITGQKKGYIKLIYTDKNGKYILDSSAIKKGRFQFHGHIAEPKKMKQPSKVSKIRLKIFRGNLILIQNR